MSGSELSILSNYIKKNNGIESIFGHIQIQVANKLGQGGNGIVYSGKINEVEVAVKFLINYNSTKLQRFKAEYLNVSMSKERLVNVVNHIQYGTLSVENVEFPYIIMKKYEKSLKKFRESLSEVMWDNIHKLFNDLCSSLQSLENCEIIHRDLKPENILIDENGNYIITDFGIAHFEAEDFPIKDLTKKGDRLANFEFSAPEQLNGKKVTFATDIYSLAQILYWFAFGHTNRGTGGKSFQEIFDNKEAKYLNSVVYKCLNNEQQDRFQTIKEITNKINEMKLSSREINPFDDMRKLSRIVRSTIPEFYKKVGFTEDIEEIREIMTKLDAAELNRPFEFNTGISNNTIDRITPLENGHYLLNCQELKVTKIWGLFGDSVYNDIFILETDEAEPYTIHGKEYFGVAVINNETIVPVDDINSGYVRYSGKVYPTNELNIQERYIYPIYRDKYFSIGAFAHCSIISENDIYMEILQTREELDETTIINFQRQISKNKSPIVHTYL